MKEQFCIILTSLENENIAETIAEELINDNLAKCINLKEVTSMYQWGGKLQKSQEFKLEIKSLAANYSEIEKRIKNLSSYEVSEIIKINIDDGSQDYLDWLKT